MTARITAYPSELVERVRTLYQQGGTMREVAAATGTTVHVLQKLMPLHGIERRRRGARDQSGPKNPNWKGDRVGMDALHYRVIAARGRPARCERCGSTTAEQYDWANLTGAYGDVNDYERQCRPCHRAFDLQRRRTTGRLTSWRTDV